MNKIVVKWAPLSAIAVLVTIASPSQAQTPPSTGQEVPRPASAQIAEPAPAIATPRFATMRTTYASADATCATHRKKLWTEAGWIVRRVTSCR